MNKKAMLLVNPYLTIHKNKIELNLLKNAKINISTTNYMNKITISNNFENLKLS